MIVERGFEVISHEVYLQWLREPQTTEEKAEILATARVAEFPAGFWRVSDPKFIDPTTVVLSAFSRLSDRAHDVTISLVAPGQYVFRGDLTVREDEI